MRSLRRWLGYKQHRSFVGDEGGVAAVEFALISTCMFAMLSGAVDLTQAITISRDLNRLAAEIAQTTTACPDLTCRSNVLLSPNQRRANLAPQLMTMTASTAYFGKANNTIVDMEGSMTELTASLRAQALAMLQNGDKGVAVQLTYTHQPIILGFAQKWGFNTKNFTASVVNVASRP
jgi:Flp pilus assembly protein TadG